jgi:hypothetical protein
METKQQHKAEVGKQVQQTEKLYMENTLLRVAGALFCHDPKRAAVRTQEIELGSGGSEKTIVIRPDLKLGQPGQLAHKIFIAILKKHSDYGRPISRDSEQLSRALHEIHYTFITAHFKKSDGR